MEFEKEIFSIITYAGDANRYAFEALDYVQEKKYEKAEDSLKEGRKCMNNAHKIQTELLFDECKQGEGTDSLSLMMVHAQDHLMNAVLVLDLVEKMISIFKSRE